MRHLPTPGRCLALALLLAGCGNPRVDAQGAAPASPQPSSTADVVRAETVASGLEHPWALAFLPDGRILVTERPGRLRIVATDGSLSAPLTGVPAVVAQGQGGLLDVAIDPDFATNRLVYLSFAEAGERGTNGAAVARGRLGDAGLEGTEVIYRQTPKVASSGHFGSRLVFARDGKLFITQGDRQSSQFRGQAQQLGSGIGKVIRINADGTVPEDNPFVGRKNALPAIWSYGHRNVQAAALDPETGKLWTVEHGARGGDELNHPEAGKNYGWPVITYGRDYSGASIGEGSASEGMEQPVYYWDPVIAPSGMLFYTGDAIPGWKGSILVGSLTPGGLVRLELRDGKVALEERYLGDLGERFRDVQQGPDGFVYVVTDAESGRVLRVRPNN
ncbi:MAG TPA: PQQ-dependent sugar dehydrogenase [Gemmatimonadaceae bacterium]|nr:PQQ-dependent sugar dehydrogenase [Gemmatimonadaceae bacterium]